jgi:flagellar biosynthetic protein FliR
MIEPLVIPLRPVLIFVVVLARIGGLVTFAPFWSHKLVAAQIRALLALALALVVAPVVAPNLPTPPTNMLALTIVIAGELLIGCALGFIGRLIFSGLEMAAQLLGFQMGFSLAGTIDPSTQAQTAAFGVMAQLLGLVILLAANGHHLFLIAAARTFQTAPPGAFNLTPTLLEMFVHLSADALAVGVALAAPAIIVLLTTEIALAIAGRAAPQLQIIVLSFPIKIAVGLWLIGASLYLMPAAVRHTLDAIRTNLARAVSAM